MPDDKIRFSCPECGKRVAAPGEKAGVRMRCPNCRSRVVVPLSTEKRGPQNRFVVAPEHPAANAPSESLDQILQKAGERGLLLGDEWLLLRCPSCEDWIKVRKRNFERLVACGRCDYEFSVDIG